MRGRWRVQWFLPSELQPRLVWPSEAATSRGPILCCEARDAPERVLQNRVLYEGLSRFRLATRHFQTSPGLEGTG